MSKSVEKIFRQLKKRPAGLFFLIFDIWVFAVRTERIQNSICLAANIRVIKSPTNEIIDAFFRKFAFLGIKYEEIYCLFLP